MKFHNGLQMNFSILHGIGKNILLKCPFIVVILSFVLVNKFAVILHISNSV